jgi:VanZ family protein
MAVIFYLSHQPGTAIAAYVPFFQRWFPEMRDFNWGHFAAYFILACTFYWALGSSRATWRGRLIAWGLCILYGLTDEFHQLFIPDRTADWRDIRNDAVGAALALLILSLPPVHRLYLRVRRSIKY